MQRKTSSPVAEAGAEAVARRREPGRQGPKGRLASPTTIAIVTVVGIAAIVGAVVWRQKIVSSPTYQLGLALQDPRVKQMEGDFARLEAQVAAHPDDVRARWKLADLNQKIGRFDQSAIQLEAITRVQPNSVDAFVALANTYLALKELGKAEATYQRVVKVQPRSAIAWQGLATSQYHNQHYLEATRTIQQAIALEPQNPNHRYVLANSLIGYVSQFPSPAPYAKYSLAAKDELEKLLPVWPVKGDIEGKLGTACLFLRDNRGAIEHYNKAIEAFPDHSDVYSAQIEVYTAIGDRVTARKVAEKGVAKCKPSSRLYDQLGDLIQTSGEPGATERALAAFQKAVDIEAKSPDKHKNSKYLEHLGTALIRSGDLNKSRDIFEQVAQMQPDRPFAFQQLAAIYTRLGDSQKSTEAAKIATALVANEQLLRQLQLLSKDDPRNAKLLTVLADRYRELHERGAARDTYLRILQIDPNNQHAKDSIASMNAEDNRLTSSP